MNKDHPLMAYQTPGELYGYCYAKFGEDGLRQLLKHNNAIHTRESLRKASTELEKAGLSAAANVVAELIPDAPCSYDVFICPHTGEWHLYTDDLTHCRERKKKKLCYCAKNNKAMLSDSAGMQYRKLKRQRLEEEWNANLSR